MYNCLQMYNVSVVYTVASTAGKIWGMKHRWTERMSSRPPPQHAEHRRRELSRVQCRGNQRLPEKRVRENVVSSSIHQGLRRSPNRQRTLEDVSSPSPAVDAPGSMPHFLDQNYPQLGDSRSSTNAWQTAGLNIDSMTQNGSSWAWLTL